MLKKISRLVFLMFLPVLLISCGSNPNKQSATQINEPQKKYTRVYVSGVSVTLIDENPDDNRLRDKKTFEDKIPFLVKEKLKDEGFTVLPENIGRRESVININVKVKYDPGNRALRWVAGMFGAGKGTIDAYVEAIDPTTGAFVASKMENNSKRMGGAGGNFYDMAESTVEDVTEALAKELSNIRL
jgi:hypothetical protein